MRIREFDILKGFAISVVVFAHAAFFNFEKFPASSQYLLMTLATFLAPAIAIFFFISGFLGYKSYVKRKNFSSFERSKFKLILPPYLMWSTVYIILQGMFGRIIGAPSNFDIISIVEKYLFGEAFLPFYYIVLLLLFYTLTPWFSTIKTKTMRKLLPPLFFTGIFVMGIYFVPQYFGKQYVHSLETYRNPFAWMFFYVWGMYNAKIGKVFWREKPSSWMITGFFLTYFLSSLEIVTVPKLNLDWESYLILGPGVYVFYYFAVRMFLWVSYKMSESLELTSKAFSALGKNSFGIYLSHGVILYSVLATVVLFNKNFLSGGHPILNSMGGLIGIILCYEFSKSVRRLPKLFNDVLM